MHTRMRAHTHFWDFLLPQHRWIHFRISKLQSVMKDGGRVTGKGWGEGGRGGGTRVAVTTAYVYACYFKACLLREETKTQANTLMMIVLDTQSQPKTTLRNHVQFRLIETEVYAEESFVCQNIMNKVVFYKRQCWGKKSCWGKTYTSITKNKKILQYKNKS